MTFYDAIVLGVGGMGSATLYHLARRGYRVLGIEQFSLGHDLGASHGVTRIIRLAYAEHPSYVPLLRRAYHLWREMEHTAGERLLFITGGLDIGAPESEMVAGSLRSCLEHEIPHQTLDAAEISRRFPGYRLPSGMVGVYQVNMRLPDLLPSSTYLLLNCGTPVDRFERAEAFIYIVPPSHTPPGAI